MRIYKNTVSSSLWKILSDLMCFETLDTFRLVGGTSLSLLLGHRQSMDIDLFTDEEYGSIDFDHIDDLFLRNFSYVEMGYGGNNSLGKSYYIREKSNECIKVDMFYTDSFIFSPIDIEGIRLARLEEIAAMKLEVIGYNGRKKDFWDLHELRNHFPLKEMLRFYEKRYPYGHSKEDLIKKLSDFGKADFDFDPICLKGKHWELIKLDFEEQVEKFIP